MKWIEKIDSVPKLVNVVGTPGENGSIEWSAGTVETELTILEIRYLNEAKCGNFARAKEVKRLMNEGYTANRIAAQLRAKPGCSLRSIKGDYAALNKARNPSPTARKKGRF